MKNQSTFIRTFSLGAGLAAMTALAVWLTVSVQAQQQEHHGKHDTRKNADHSSHVVQMKHISTQAQAEALKPGDMIAMACSMCKNVVLHHASKDNSHVKLLTPGEKHKCVCGGDVTVVGTGKGTGKHEQLRHDCSSCGKDTMFVCATSPGAGHDADDHTAHGKSGHGDHKSGHGRHKKDKK